MNHLLGTHRAASIRQHGFTLIELLIVVAIISILAAIAVPNFLEAQTRSKVARVKADMRSMATGLESYMIDNNHYPPPVEFGIPYTWGDITQPPFSLKMTSNITTPIAYMTSLPNDVFSSGKPYAVPPPPIAPALFTRFFYVNISYLTRTPTPPPPSSPFILASANGGVWMLFSVGPDKDEFNRGNPGPPADDRLFRDYDPTNGSISLGNVFRTHRSNDGIGYHPQLWQNP